MDLTRWYEYEIMFLFNKNSYCKSYSSKSRRTAWVCRHQSRMCLVQRTGPYTCYDAVMTAHDISQLFKTGFLKVDDERQRGIDSVTGKQVRDDEKVERWAEQLLKGEAYLGQLSWNFRKDETTLEYDEEKRSLKIGAGAATIPDSSHRHMALLKAAESVNRGSSFR